MILQAFVDFAWLDEHLKNNSLGLMDKSVVVTASLFLFPALSHCARHFISTSLQVLFLDHMTDALLSS